MQNMTIMFVFYHRVSIDVKQTLFKTASVVLKRSHVLNMPDNNADRYGNSSVYTDRNNH